MHLATPGFTLPRQTKLDGAPTIVDDNYGAWRLPCHITGHISPCATQNAQDDPKGRENSSAVLPDVDKHLLALTMPYLSGDFSCCCVCGALCPRLKAGRAFMKVSSTLDHLG